jgi:Mlc titration factor MtfA (ptsG expression regulator)
MFGFLFKNRRRQKLLAERLTDEWLQALQQCAPIYDRMPPKLQEKLARTAFVLVSERSFVGIRGLSLTEETKLTIAAQAALLLLGDEGYYFDRVSAIYVQPSCHETRVVHDLGSAVLVEEDVPASGQAHEHSEIRLAWDEVQFAAADPTDGENVVLHEFAHHLDALDGEIDGIPPLADRDLRRRWPEVLDREVARLRSELRSRREPFLHDGAADSRVELFAYATETFFEQPRELAELHPEMFECLLGFYKVDPRGWMAAGFGR